MRKSHHLLQTWRGTIFLVEFAVLQLMHLLRFWDRSHIFTIRALEFFFFLAHFQYQSNSKISMFQTLTACLWWCKHLIQALSEMKSINLLGVQQICRNSIALEQVCFSYIFLFCATMCRTSRRSNLISLKLSRQWQRSIPYYISRGLLVFIIFYTDLLSGTWTWYSFVFILNCLELLPTKKKTKMHVRLSFKWVGLCVKIGGWLSFYYYWYCRLWQLFHQ